MKEKQKEYNKNRYHKLMVKIEFAVWNGGGDPCSIRRPISIYFFVKLYGIFIYNKFV